MNITLKRSIRLAIAGLLAVPFMASAATSSGDEYSNHNNNLYYSQLATDVNVPVLIRAMNKHDNMIKFANSNTYFGYFGALKSSMEYSTRGVADGNSPGEFGIQDLDANYDKSGKLNGTFSGSFGFNTRTDLQNKMRITSNVAVGVGDQTRIGPYTDWNANIEGLEINYGTDTTNLMVGLGMSNFVDPFSMAAMQTIGLGYLNQLQLRFTEDFGMGQLSLAIEKAHNRFYNKNDSSPPSPTATTMPWDSYKAWDQIPDITARLGMWIGAGSHISLSVAVQENRVRYDPVVHTGSEAKPFDIIDGSMGYAVKFGLRLATMGMDSFTFNLGYEKGAAKYLGVNFGGWDGYIDGQHLTSPTVSTPDPYTSKMTLASGYIGEVGYVHYWNDKMWSAVAVGGQRSSKPVDFGPHNKNMFSQFMNKHAYTAGANINYLLTSNLTVTGQWMYMKREIWMGNKGNNQLFGIYANFTF